MELIVKIGADQQNLQATVDRMKTQFKNMNLSLPMGWQAQSAARQQYGGILSAAAPSHGGFMDAVKGIPVIGHLAEKFEGLIGPVSLVSAGMGLLAAQIHGIGNAISQASADLRAARITGMSGLMARRWRQAGEAAGVEGGDGMVSKLQATVGAFNAGDGGAQKLFGEIGVNPSGLATDDLLVELKKKFAVMKDPAMRARLAKGLFGKGGFEVTELLAKLEAPGAADTEGMDMAAAAGLKKWWKTIKRNAGDAAETLFTKAAAVVANSRLAGWLGVKPGKELESGVAGEQDEPLKEEARREEKRRDLKVDRSAIERKRARDRLLDEASDNQVAETKDRRFEADAMARAGLYQGSSMLFNPSFNVEQEQLEVLREINGKMKSSNLFSP